jgi:hypothetical protein
VRDLTSTKREFTALGRRLYRRGPRGGSSCVNRAFRGVVESGFGVWIRGHWGLSNPGSFRPAPREFETQKKPFALLNWPQPRRSGDVNYTFSPTIHLSCFPQQTNQSLFELDASGVLQTLTLKQSSQTRDEVFRDVLVEGTDRRTRDYRSLERIFQIFNRESNTHRQSTRLKEFLSSLFSTFSRTVGEVITARDVERSFSSREQRFDNERSLRTKEYRFNSEKSFWSTEQRRDVERSLRTEMRWLSGATSFRRDFALVRPAAATTETHNRFFALQPSILTRFSNNATANKKTAQLQSTTNPHTHLGHQFLTAAKNVQHNRESHYGPNVFTTLAVNFAAPKISETELVAKRISQLVSSPQLTHIKRPPAISEEMINALRGLRTPQVESKPVTVPITPSIEQLTNQVRTQLERELRIERERRGL